MRTRIFYLLAIALLLAACAPNETAMRSTETQIAANIFATLTASAPTLTPAFTATPDLPPTLTPQPTDMPLVQAVVRAAQLNLRDGPATEYPLLATLNWNDVISVNGQYLNCDWLHVKIPSGMEGWIKAGSNFATYDQDCSIIPPGRFRPLSGYVVIDSRPSIGQGTLVVENGVEADALVILTDMQAKPVYAYYVRTPEKYTLTGLPDGQYQVYFETGEGWSWIDRRFSTTKSMLKYDIPFTFTTSTEAITTLTLALHDVEEGELTASEITPEELPAFSQ